MFQRNLFAKTLLKSKFSEESQKSSLTPPVPYNSVHTTTLSKTTTELSILPETIEQSTIQPITRDLTTISENFEKKQYSVNNKGSINSI